MLDLRIDTSERICAYNQLPLYLPCMALQTHAERHLSYLALSWSGHLAHCCFRQLAVRSAVSAEKTLAQCNLCELAVHSQFSAKENMPSKRRGRARERSRTPPKRAPTPRRTQFGNPSNNAVVAEVQEEHVAHDSEALPNEEFGRDADVLQAPASDSDDVSDGEMAAMLLQVGPFPGSDLLALLPNYAHIARLAILNPSATREAHRASSGRLSQAAA